MLRPRTHRCNQLNLNQQRLVRESFPISSIFQAVYKVAAPRLVKLAGKNH